MQGKSTRKYRCEFGIHSFCTFYAMLQQDQLKEIPDEFPDTHIYLIGRRPRIMLDEKINATADTVDGRYAVICGEHKDFHAFSVPNGMGTGDIRISCPYPYTHFQILDHNGKIWRNNRNECISQQDDTV